MNDKTSAPVVSEQGVSRIVIALFAIIAGYMLYRLYDPVGFGMNAVLVSVSAMLLLSLVRVNVVISLIVASLLGGVIGGLSIEKTVASFNAGLSGGAQIALSYALLGAFAVAISKSGVPHMLADRIAAMLGQGDNARRTGMIRNALIGLILVFACSSQNIIPIHIAFIPLLIPPLLYVIARLQMDRRLVACVLTFGLVTPYMLLPVGFGSIFLNDILLVNITKSGLDVSDIDPFSAMLIPGIGMIVGLLVAVFISYRGKREYNMALIARTESTGTPYSRKTLIVAAVAILAAFLVQLETDSMVLGGLIGFLIFSLSGVLKWREGDDAFTEGMKMLAMVGFIMIAASGFAQVLRDTGHIGSLVSASAGIVEGNRELAALAMLVVGLLVTMGIGSSFSTIPIIAAIYVPLAVQLGFSPMATVALVGTAAALGDAGSPASDSTLGPTAGLNIDGQHNHIWDTVVPTFLHYNLPLLLFGWFAACTL